MTTDNGGFAFPLPGDGDHNGMTLRDWFAGQALAGLLADTSNTDPGNIHGITGWPKVAYAVADVMIAERSKPTPPSNANAQTGAK